MILDFYKYEGTGNDFVLIDDRIGSVNMNAKQVAKICDRRFGIGADGVILLRNKIGYDFEMIYYNSDGNLSSMCGNGGRCIMSFARKLGIVKDKAIFWAADGRHEAELISADPDIIKLKMNDVSVIEEKASGWFLDTGSPHLVMQVSELTSMDVRQQGRSIRNGMDFKEQGVNVNFSEISGDGLSVRTYERGVEDETLSCGTGVTATALVAMLNNWKGATEVPVKVSTPGGVLFVHAVQKKNSFENIWLEGPGTFVFKGEMQIS